MKCAIIGAKEIKTQKFLEDNKFQVSMILARYGLLGDVTKGMHKTLKELGEK